MKRRAPARSENMDRPHEPKHRNPAGGVPLKGKEQ